MTYSDLEMFETSYSAFKGRNSSIKNCIQGIRICQLATASASDILNVLQEIRSLAVNNASESLSDPDKDNNKTAIDKYLDEIGRIAKRTEFNDTKIIDGTKETNGFNIHIGYNSNQTVELKFKNYQNASGSVHGGVLDNTSTSDTIDVAIKNIAEEISLYEANKDRLIIASEYLRNLNVVEIKNMISLRDISDEVKDHVDKLDRLQTSSYVPIDWDYADRKINYLL